MAKKSSKKKTLKLVFTCLEVVFAIAALCMIFLPAIGVKDSDTSYSGLNAVFGYSTKTNLLVSTVETQVFSFSFLNLLTYLLVLIAVVLLILKLAFKKQAKLVNLLSIILLIVAGVFFFLVVQFSVVAEGFSKLYAAFGSDPKAGLTLGIGAILGGVFALVSALATIGEIVLAD